MRKVWRIGFIVSVSATLLTASACTTAKQKVQSSTEKSLAQSKAETAKLMKDGNGMHILSVIPQGSDANIPITKIGNKNYVAAQALADVLEYQTKWDHDSSTMKIGVNAPDYELKAESAQAVKMDRPLALSSPPIINKDALYIPVDVLPDLFGSDMSFRSTDSEVTITPVPVKVDKTKIFAPDEPDVKDERSFEDDPAYKSHKKSPSAQLPTPHHHPAAANKTIDPDQMEKTARRYMGIKYKFGTGPYQQTGFFDCSSFMQFLFEKQGITLPRTARAQADEGVTVNRKNLQPGDMLFFYVPGRFRSDAVIGHVGLYIGNSMMIHSSPKPEDGVQLTNINKEYWKNTFVKAVRVGSSSL